MSDRMRRPLPPAVRAAINASTSSCAFERPPAPPTPRRGRKNRTEEAYAAILQARKLAREVEDFGFERVKLRLADGAWYTPDFDVTLADGSLEFHETKGGFIREAGMLRIKVAAHQYPHWRFYLVQHKDGQWGRRLMLP